MRRTRSIMLATAFALVIAACAGAAEDGTTTEGDIAPPATDAPEPTDAPDPTDPPATTTTAPPATTEPAGPEGEIPELNVGQTLMPYATEDITAGPVVVYWYRGTGGTYLAVYTGQGIAEAEGLGLCPGNSINSGGVFSHVSNTPFEATSCQGFPTPPSSMQWCSSGVWIYETLIPNDLEGDLWGSPEWNSADGTVKGLTSQSPTSADMPEFEYGLASYTIPPWFTSDGSSVIQCGAPSA